MSIPLIKFLLFSFIHLLCYLNLNLHTKCLVVIAEERKTLNLLKCPPCFSVLIRILPQQSTKGFVISSFTILFNFNFFVLVAYQPLWILFWMITASTIITSTALNFKFHIFLEFSRKILTFSQYFKRLNLIHNESGE